MNVTDIIHLFNRTVQKISYSFISHEIITLMTEIQLGLIAVKL